MAATGRRRILAAACAIVAAVAVVAAASREPAAQAAVGTPQSPPKVLVSGRYQAISCDIAAPSGDFLRQDGLFRAATVAQAGFPAANAQSGGLNTPRSNFRYSLRLAISNDRRTGLNDFRYPTARSTPGSCSRTSESILRTTFESNGPANGRRLFQIAVAFAFAYVVFLTVWFWETRERRSRVGSAAGS